MISLYVAVTRARIKVHLKETIPTWLVIMAIIEIVMRRFGLLRTYFNIYLKTKLSILYIGFDFVHQNMLSIFLVKNIFFKTGDLPPHNVWNQTKSDQVYALRKLTQLFIKYFPNSIIYPTLGNHEAAPCNLFVIFFTNNSKNNK